MSAFYFRLASLSEVCEENMDIFHYFTSTELDEEVPNDFTEVYHFTLASMNYHHVSLSMYS